MPSVRCITRTYIGDTRRVKPSGVQFPPCPPKMSVVNVRKMNGKRAKYDVYIGRDVKYGSIHFPGSKWQNPFHVDQYGREKCLEMYEKYIRTLPRLYNSLHELKGKILGCWCKPLPCHGDVLLKLIDEGVV